MQSSIWFFILLSSFNFLFAPAEKEAPAYAWLEGSWIGDGFGGTSEEVWSAPSSDGTMMGVYRHHKGDGTLNFYEFLTINEQGLRLKHFTPEMISWEDKEDLVEFDMIDFDDRTIRLKGLTFAYQPPNAMTIELDLKDAEGRRYTEVFQMRRK